MVPMLPLRVWVHCPRASNGLLPPRSYLVGYVRWDARSDSYSSFRQSFQQLSVRTPVSPSLGQNRYSVSMRRIMTADLLRRSRPWSSFGPLVCLVFLFF